MQKKKLKIVTVILIIVFMFVNINTTIVNGKEKAKLKEYYESNYFNLNKNQLNIIINSIYEKDSKLFMDAYLFNETSVNFNEITNFNIVFKDIQGKVFAQKNFKKIDIKEGLLSYQGKKVIFDFEKDQYDMDGVDLSKLSWNFTYNYR